ncbi:MAG: tRNA (adenosine(37)-N6)-threonylcarbamoyltransferase complex dimerization subunit type 1 TsaB [Actinomycetota bacterium]
MKVLGFDTATPVTSVALSEDGRIIAELSITGDRTQMERLMPMIDAALKDAGVKVRDIDGIAVGTGPGLFTALRIGVATANALSQALRVPIAGVSSLDALAKGCAGSGETIAAVIDAKRGEVFASLYISDAGLNSLVWAAGVFEPETLARRLAVVGGEVIAVGNGVIAYQNIFKEYLGDNLSVAAPELMFPRAAAVIELGEPALREAPKGLPGQVRPVYVRQPDADKNIKKMKQ